MIIDFDKCLRKQDEKRDEKLELETVRRVRSQLSEDMPDFQWEGNINDFHLWVAQYYLWDQSVKARKRSVEIFGEKPPEDYPKPKQSLALIGGPGRGKSTLAEWFSSFFKVQFHAMTEIDSYYGVHGLEKCKEDFPEVWDRESPVIIDDVGAEVGYKHYGNPPVFDKLMENLHRKWKYCEKPIIITTNLKTKKDASDLDTIYSKGERTYSRFCQQFLLVKLLGKDHRLE